MNSEDITVIESAAYIRKIYVIFKIFLRKNCDFLFNSTQYERNLLYFNALTHFQLYTNYSLTLH